MTRTAEPDEIVRSLRGLIKRANDAGWESRVTYSPEHGSLGVRLHHHGAAADAMALWVDGGFDMAYRWAPAWGQYTERIGFRLLSAWVVSVGELAEAAA